jgi:hypothetical protein
MSTHTILLWDLEDVWAADVYPYDLPGPLLHAVESGSRATALAEARQWCEDNPLERRRPPGVQMPDDEIQRRVMMMLLDGPLTLDAIIAVLGTGTCTTYAALQDKPQWFAACKASCSLTAAGKEEALRLKRSP